MFFRLDMSGTNKFKAMLSQQAFLILQPLTCGEYVVSSDMLGTEKFKGLVTAMSFYFYTLSLSLPEASECDPPGEGSSR